MWFSMDLNVFFFPHCDYPRGKNSNCRKCLVFFPLMGKKKKKKRASGKSTLRKTIIGPSGRTEGRNGPMGNKQALTGLRAALCGWTLVPVGTGNGHPNVRPWPFKVGFQGAVKRQQVDSPSSTCFTQGTGAWWALRGA